jgi:hypothetical protein
LTYRHGSSVYEIKAIRHEKESAILELDGVEVGFIPLDYAGGTHHVIVRLPAAGVDRSADVPEAETEPLSTMMVSNRG